MVYTCTFVFSQLALLCGAPGLGKTTLAHIIAKHAGYYVVEMNARLDIYFHSCQPSRLAGQSRFF